MLEGPAEEGLDAAFAAQPACAGGGGGAPKVNPLQTDWGVEWWKARG